MERLKKHGFSPVYSETGGGHTRINWRNYLYEFAPQLFGRWSACGGGFAEARSAQSAETADLREATLLSPTSEARGGGPGRLPVLRQILPGARFSAGLR